MAHEATEAKLREGWFWAAVFRDHATFIHDRLAPDAGEAIRWAKAFRERFTARTEEASALAGQAGIAGPAGSFARPSGPGLLRFGGHELGHYEQATERLVAPLVNEIAEFMEYKRCLVELKLDCAIKLALGPGLLQHMVNEADEAILALNGMREELFPDPASRAMHTHLVWLPDSAGHAAALDNDLDGSEKLLKGRAREFQQIFEGMQLKATELATMLQVRPRMVGALRRLNVDALIQVGLFRSFLAELREHTAECEVLGNLVPLFADHMLREELYYMEQIKAIQG
ncbi:MAG TPA: DUF2935 domain-containing protein [Symbiobacteriaceae bacterium]|nr:DUF2935 domain-containing protein [Symbiobacteriaceae bacterium]